MVRCRGNPCRPRSWAGAGGWSPIIQTLSALEGTPMEGTNLQFALKDSKRCAKVCVSLDTKAKKPYTISSMFLSSKFTIRKKIVTKCTPLHTFCTPFSRQKVCSCKLCVTSVSTICNKMLNKKGVRLPAYSPLG